MAPGRREGVRVGLFTDSFRPYVSGVVRSIEVLRQGLVGRGHRVFIFAPDYPGDAGREDGVFRFCSLPAPTHGEFRLGLPFSWRLGDTVRRLGLDLIHVHSPFLMGWLGLRCARRHRLPLVFTYHTFYHRYVHYVPFAREWAARAVTAWSARFASACDLVVAPSPGAAAFLRDIGVRSRVAVVPTGVDLDLLAGGDGGAFRRRRGLEGNPLLLYVGRVAREKDLPFLLRAFRLVSAAVPAARLVVTGDGPALAEVRRRAAAEGLGGRILFTGRLEGEELAACYRAADVFVFPSLTETQGLVLAEAMAAGLPVVARRAEALEAVLTDGREGFLCGGDEEEFARLVLFLLRDGERRRRMGGLARLRAESFSRSAMVGRLESHYLALLPRPGRPAAARPLGAAPCPAPRGGARRGH